MSAPAPHGRLVGLLGYPVEHSLSPAMHNAAFAELGIDLRYVLHSVAPEEFEGQVRRCVDAGYVGWNITVPHKERMVDYLDEVSVEVAVTGACNTVLVDGGRLLGVNTDPAGFMAGLEAAGGIEPGLRAVVLGAGGAARAVAWALSRAGHPVLVLSRRPEQAAQVVRQVAASTGARVDHGGLDASSLDSALAWSALLVNCTPAGMHPDEQGTPLPGSTHLPAHLLVYDLVYRPRPTRLLREAAAAGCRVQDGLAMLVGQGAAAFEIWTGRPAPRGTMLRACLEELSGVLSQPAKRVVREQTLPAQVQDQTHF